MLVSIIIPTKNRCDLLRETLASVLAQTLANWEAIVVDDGSSDGTSEMVLSMASTDQRVRFIKREGKPSGASASRNQGVVVARGDYVLFLDSDDLLAPSCLEKRVEIMERSPELDCVVYLTQLFHTAPGDRPHLWNNFTEEDDLDRFLRRDPPWQTSGPLWRKTSLAKIGSWDERALSAQDWEFHLRALAANLNYRKISEVDSFWRVPRPDSLTSQWKSPRRMSNRLYLLKKITAVLRSRKPLTPRRQRLLASEYYEYAFILNPNLRMAHKIWARARRQKIIGPFAYYVVLASDLLFRLARRTNEFIRVRLLPETRLTRTMFTVESPAQPSICGGHRRLRAKCNEAAGVEHP
jgi:glycosyltransferase involved in cell wall biosynthesis